MNTPKNIIFDLHGVLFERVKDGSIRFFITLPAGVALLQECRTALAPDGRIFACTNWSAPSVEQLQEEHPEVMDLFDGIVSASHAGARKPDPRIFEYLFDLHDTNASEVIFIDDQLDNVLAARALGMIALHADGFDRLRDELTQLGVL